MTYSKFSKAVIILMVVAMISVCAVIACAQLAVRPSADTPLAASTPAKVALPENLKTIADDAYLTSKEALTAPLQTNVNAVSLGSDSSAPSDPESYPLYDFEGDLTAYCVIYDDGYAIINSETETVYESSLSEHPYAGINADRYIYISPLNYAYLSGENYYFVGDDGSALSAEAVDKLQSVWEELASRDIAIKISDTANRVETAALTDPDMSNITLLYSDVAHLLHASYFILLCEYSISSPLGDDGDFPYPDNNGTSCAYVAMTMILQYYERMGLCDLIPSLFDSYLNATSLENSKTQAIHDMLWEMGGESFAMTDKIVRVFNEYFDEYGYNAHATYHALYAGLKDSIDDHRPAIGEIGYYKGFFWDTVDGSFTTDYIPNHQVVIFGYTQTSSGTLQNFICHTGWSGSKPLVINKAAFFANATITVPGV